MSTNQVTLLSIKELLNGSENYTIPRYQRNYAWEMAEITQLIRDIADHAKKQEQQYYYVGTLIVSKRTNSYEVIDGQQRLTTLTLLILHLKNHQSTIDLSWYNRVNIHFDSRENSKKTFDAFINGKKPKPEDSNKSLEIGLHDIIERYFPRILMENGLDTNTFINYFLNRVKIVRIPVPEETDVNHYFEAMNNRGEQLEKHEILKANLLRIISNENTIPDKLERNKNETCVHIVWEACSNMEKYVQFGFSTAVRKEIFPNDGSSNLLVNNFDSLCEILNKPSLSPNDNQRNNDQNKLIHLIEENRGENTNKENELTERFQSVINFPNFLLHTLSVHSNNEISLDDKHLIKEFEDHIIKYELPESTKEFIFNLLKCRYLFDSYIIKKDASQEKSNWSLKRFGWKEERNSVTMTLANTFGETNNNEGENLKTLMLLSALHVSAPAQSYKYWLNAALHYLFANIGEERSTIDAKNYRQHMESIAKAFVFDRYISPNEKSASYYDIIYKHKGQLQNTYEVHDPEKLKQRLTYNEIPNHLVFNYLDYLLWLAEASKDRNKDNEINSFRFTQRNSIEHFYPQNPADTRYLEERDLHSFGNLCLISHSNNSDLRNYMPKDKKRRYEEKVKKIDSIKQYLMFKDAENWDANTISLHCKQMVDVLLNSLKVDCNV